MRIAPIVLVTLSCLVSANPLAAEQGVERVGWLSGCWQSGCWQVQFGEPGTIEQWLAPAGGTMLGVSRTIKQGKTVEFEFMQLRQLPDGVLAFIAQPGGRAPTVFRSSHVGTLEVVFENLQNDFPQRVSYSRPDQSRLLASIEGVSEGTNHRIDFSFVRVDCDA